MSATELSRKLEDGSTTSVAIVEDCLARIQACDSDLRAWAHVDRDLALAQARLCDAQPRRSPLHGVPVGVKDVFDTYDMPTEYGSKIYKDHRPTSDTALVGAMRSAGMVILGKCTTTEFASPLPVGVRNPHDFNRSPGVSSSGSAAAVVDYMTPLAIGSQTGGSVILPAAFCGIVGYKASLLGLDRGNVRHLKASIDTMGLFGRTISDIALLHSVLSSSLIVKPVSNLKGARIGVCRTKYWKAAQVETVQALANASHALSAAGATLQDVELPAIFENIEASRKTVTDVERVRAMDEEARHHFNALNFRIRDSLETTKNISLTKYYEAQQHLVQCRKALAVIFDDYDALITPSATGEATPDLTAVSNSVFNSLWTILHVPCVTIPAFEGPNMTPVGVQLVGPVNTDGRLLALAQGVGATLSMPPSCF